MNELIPAKGACYVDLLIRMAQDAAMIDELAGVQRFPTRHALRKYESNCRKIFGNTGTETRITVGAPLTMSSRRHELPNAQMTQGFDTAQSSIKFVCAMKHLSVLTHPHLRQAFADPNVCVLIYNFVGRADVARLERAYGAFEVFGLLLVKHVASRK